MESSAATAVKVGAGLVGNGGYVGDGLIFGRAVAVTVVVEVYTTATTTVGIELGVSCGLAQEIKTIARNVNKTILFMPLGCVGASLKSLQPTGTFRRRQPKQRPVIFSGERLIQPAAQ